MTRDAAGIRRSHRRDGRRVVAAAGALAIGGTLMGCSASADDEPPRMPFETVAMPVDTAPEAAPGQRLQAGEIALLPQTDPTGEPDDAIETTVIGVVEGDATYWDEFDNGTEFANETPFFAVMQYRWVTGEVYAAATPTLTPLLDDGTEGGMLQREYLGSLTADTACPFEVGSLDMDEGRGPEEYIACVVYTAPTDSTIVGLGWKNDSSTVFSASDPELNPFFADPVVWDVDPITASDES